ncbi:MAG TPA: hypothetical protein VMG12_16930 [Polyangiaceae bacterium]|nr:hypothetical protein [Polyangiaceae bacterium]
MKRTAFGYGALAVLLPMVAVQGCDAQAEPGYPGEPLLRLQGRVEALQSGASTADEADVGVLWLRSSADDECTGPEPTCQLITGLSYSAETDVECLAACESTPDCLDTASVERWQACQEGCGNPVEVQHELRYRACASAAVGQRAPVVGAFPAQFGLDVLLPPPESALLASSTGERVALGYFVAIASGADALDVALEDSPPEWLIGGSETHVLLYAADAISAESSWGAYLGEAFTAGFHLLRVEFGNRCGLPRLYADTTGGMFSPEGDSEGSDSVPQRDVGAEDVGAPMSDDGGEGEIEQLMPPQGGSGSGRDADYTGTPFVCGNGVCEPNENCDICSDCVACDGASAGMSSGRSNLDDDYFCESTSSRLRPSLAGSEADIELLIARPDLIAWPEL